MLKQVSDVFIFRIALYSANYFCSLRVLCSLCVCVWAAVSAYCKMPCCQLMYLACVLFATSSEPKINDAISSVCKCY